MLEGWREYRRRADAGIGRPAGIDAPARMRDLKDTLMEHADPIGEFIKDCCAIDPGAVGIRTSQFFRVYSRMVRHDRLALLRQAGGLADHARKGDRAAKGRRRDHAFWAGSTGSSPTNMTALLKKCWLAGEDDDPEPSAAPSPRDLGIDPDAPF